MNRVVNLVIHKSAIGITQAVLVCLGVGLLFVTLGRLVDFPLLITLGSSVKMLFIPAIGGMIAYQFRANPLTVIAAMGAAIMGGQAIKATDAGIVLTLGEPIGAMLSAIITTYVGKKVSGKSRFDMISTPTLALFAGGVSGYGLSFIINPVLIFIGGGITAAVSQFPLLGSVTIGIIWGLFIVSPASSAALAIALKLDPVSSGAALIGCTIQFTAFSVMSYRENAIGAVIAQFVCTPKLQLPNIIKNPLLLLPSIVATAICAPLATLIGGLVAPNTVAGLGLCALIAPLNILENQGISMLGVYVMTGIVLPAVMVLFIAWLMIQKGVIKKNDFALPI